MWDISSSTVCWDKRFYWSSKADWFICRICKLENTQAFSHYRKLASIFKVYKKQISQRDRLTHESKRCTVETVCWGDMHKCCHHDASSGTNTLVPGEKAKKKAYPWKKQTNKYKIHFYSKYSIHRRDIIYANKMNPRIKM